MRRVDARIILAIDIGNTTVSFGVLNDETVVSCFSIVIEDSKKKLRVSLNKILSNVQRKFPCLEGVIICSVVPDITKMVEAEVKTCCKKKALVVGRDVKVPIKNRYLPPSQVGQDRLVGAYAVKCLYGEPAIIIDFGTAITFDVVSSKGEYEGGIIIPGVRLSAQSLFDRTALLPNIQHFKAPKNLIGKNTKESILSGIFYGYGAMCKGLIVQLSKEIKDEPKVVITGGYTDVMKKFIESKITKIDRELVFKGMRLLYP